MTWRIAAIAAPSRRGFLGSLAAAGGATLLPGAAQAAPPAAMLDAESPIVPRAGPADGYLGDAPDAPHGVLWGLTGAPGVEAAERTEPMVDLVVVGGGVSGLAAAWLLRDRQPVVLEQAARFGGNSRGETWEGIDYALGAAYFAQAPPSSSLYRSFYKPLGLPRLWRVSKEEAFLFAGAVRSGFWEGVTDPAAKAEFRRTKAYFLDVLNHGYPDMPPGDDQVLSDAELTKLDARSFREEVERGIGGPMHPHIRAALEYYCWSSLGGSMDELSAAAALNFYTAEFAPLNVLPGGNARVAERLLAGLRSTTPADRLRTNQLVTRVEVVADHVVVHARGADGAPYALPARAVVMAIPKFVAAHLLPGLPPDQLAAMRRLQYRAYLTANVLCIRPTPAEYCDLYLLGDGAPMDLSTPEAVTAAARSKGCTDVILAHWASGERPDRSVLTLYRALPYEGGRAGVLDPGSFASFRDAFLADITPILGLLGLSSADVAEVRVSRFGHALPLAAKGLVADGTLAIARRTFGDRVFFVEQDNWALPSLETCLVSALQAEPALRKRLA